MANTLRLFICLVLNLVALNTYAQNKNDSSDLGLDSMLTKAQMVLDLDTLYKVVLNTHQNHQFYCKKGDFDRAYQNARRQCMEPMTLVNFAEKVAVLLGTLQDSHTYLQYKSLLSKHAKNNGKYYGFGVKAIGADLFIKSDRADLIPLGSKLISINGIKPTVLFNKVNNLSVQEGNSLTGRRRISEILFSRFSGIFSAIADSNKVEFLPYGQDSVQQVWYPGKTSKEWKKGSEKSPKAEVISMTFNDTTDLAILKIRSFASGKNRKYYKTLHKFFKELAKRNTQNLVIDLRGNTGGKSERMEQVFAYLTADTICTPTNIIARQSLLSQKRFADDLNWLENWMMHHAPKKSEDLRNYLTMMDLPVGESDTVYYTQGEHVKQKHIFKYNTHLFIDGASGSASANFAGTFQLNQLGDIWGEPCLGPVGGTWGNPAAFTLPNSGIGVYISTIRFNNSDDMLRDSSPVKPNHRIEIDQVSLTDKRDVVLDKLIESISSSSK